MYSPKSFEAKYGIQVEQFLDLKVAERRFVQIIFRACRASAKRAPCELLKRVQNARRIYENLALIKESTRKKLEAGKDLAYLSKKLARIWTDAPMKLDLKEVDGSKMRARKVLELLQKLEFRSLARQLPEVMQVTIDDHHAATGGGPLKAGKNMHYR